MDNIVKLLNENKYSELKEIVQEEIAIKIADRINNKKDEILNKLRGK